MITNRSILGLSPAAIGTGMQSLARPARDKAFFLNESNIERITRKYAIAIAGMFGPASDARSAAILFDRGIAVALDAAVSEGWPSITDTGAHIS